MKILILTHYFLPHTGGIEIVAYNQAKELVKRGHNVTIVTSQLSNEPSISKLEGITIKRVKASNILENKFGIPYPFFSSKLYTLLREEIQKADLVHTHGHVYLPSVLAAFLTTKNNKKFIVTQHNIFIHYKNPLFRYLQKTADKTLGKFTLSRANKIITVSKESKKYVYSMLKTDKNVLLSYNGVDIDKFKPVKNKSELKKLLNIENKFICFTVRRVTFKNGIDTLLQTAEELKKNNDILFLIGGKGADFEKAKKYIEINNLQNVRLLGFISDEDLVKYYSASDVFILPSKTGEGFPLSILEALASGIPVIATRSGGHVEIIDKEKNGYIVNPNDYKKIADVISLFAKNKKLMKKMKDFSRKLSVDKFSWEENINQLITIYNTQ